jgi:hypothetical protein
MVRWCQTATAAGHTASTHTAWTGWRTVGSGEHCGGARLGPQAIPRRDQRRRPRVRLRARRRRPRDRRCGRECRRLEVQVLPAIADGGPRRIDVLAVRQAMALGIQSLSVDVTWAIELPRECLLRAPGTFFYVHGSMFRPAASNGNGGERDLWSHPGPARSSRPCFSLTTPGPRPANSCCPLCRSSGFRDAMSARGCWTDARALLRREHLLAVELEQLLATTAG